METSVGSVGIISLSQGVVQMVVVEEDASEASEVNVYDADMIDDVDVVGRPPRLGIGRLFRLLEGC